MSPGPAATERLLSASDVRAIAERLELRPTKTLGQNFVVDAGTVRKIVRSARLEPGQVVLEVGPGLGSLTLGLLEAGMQVIAVEIDPVLAEELPQVVARQAPGRVGSLTVVNRDAMRMGDLPLQPSAMVSNLPYNVAVPVLLTALSELPGLGSVLVMVQAEVADRIAAPPGSRTYGVPSAKAAWFAGATRAGSIGRAVFWPVPRVDSALVRLQRRPPPQTPASRAQVFTVIDAAFSQRRKMLRSALATWAGSASRAQAVLEHAGVDPAARAERIDIAGFAAIAGAGLEVP